MTSITGNNSQDHGQVVSSAADDLKKIGGVVENAVDVDHSTLSTTEQQTRNIIVGQVDGSVISAITDHASLGGSALNSNYQTPAGIGVHGASPVDTSVPTQVILPERESGQPRLDGVSSSEIDQDYAQRTEPDVPQSAKQETRETVTVMSMPVFADRNNGLTERRPIADRSGSGSATHTTTPVNNERSLQYTQQKQQTDNGSEDLVKSPEVRDAIMERSPGGRYLRFMEKLGSGATKDVYRAYDTQEGIEVAWNVVPLSGVPKSERNRIVNEVRLLERLHHANIISFHGSWVNRERQEVNFVTEILSSGTLKSFVKKVQVIRWKIAKRWAIQILKGLEYLHSQDPPVIHRDLKCDNIFINGTSGDLRIGDLGLSTASGNGKALSVLGTPEFMAPDMYEEHPYDEKVDIYAFGMCMLEILTKEIPYAECNNPAQIYKKVSSGLKPEVLSRLQSRHAREFVELCMGHKDESGRYVRPSAAELLNHPFLMKRSSDDDEVVVERPLREKSLYENVVESNGDSSSAQHQKMAPRAGPHTLDLEEVKDHFNDMPESETNMKKVTVLMGRDQILNEDEETLQQPAMISGGAPEIRSPIYGTYSVVAPQTQQTGEYLHVQETLRTPSAPSNQQDAQPRAASQTFDVNTPADNQSHEASHDASSNEALQPNIASRTQQYVQPAATASSIAVTLTNPSLSKQTANHVSARVTPRSFTASQDQKEAQLAPAPASAMQAVWSEVPQVQQPKYPTAEGQKSHVPTQDQKIDELAAAPESHATSFDKNHESAQHSSHQDPALAASTFQQQRASQHPTLHEAPPGPLTSPEELIPGNSNEGSPVLHSKQPQHQESISRQTSDVNQSHYLVAAAVIENEGPNIRPYADDILKLVVTLPVEGQTQNVQFDFHLVEDDPIKVAKEMVQELGIPTGAVLEISETISGLACSARMKQDKHAVSMQKKHSLSQQTMSLSKQDVQDFVVRETSATHGQIHPDFQIQDITGQAAAVSTDGDQMAISQGMEASAKAIETASIPVPLVSQSISSGTNSTVSHVGHPVFAPDPVVSQGTRAVDRTSSTSLVPASSNSAPGLKAVNTAPIGKGTTIRQPASVNFTSEHTSLQGNTSNSGDTATHSMSQRSSQRSSALATEDGISLPQQDNSSLTAPSPSSYTAANKVAADQNISLNAAATPSAQIHASAQMPSQMETHGDTRGAILHQVAVPQAVSQEPDLQKILTTQEPLNIVTTAPQTGSVAPISANDGIRSSASSSPSSGATTALTGISSRQQATSTPHPESLVDTSSKGHNSEQKPYDIINGLSALADGGDIDWDTDDEEVRAALRKLEEDYQKNLKIARKVFDSRMENLERSRIEKEAQHKETLEKHEKERLAFEKKRAIEEEQQLRRIEQLQKEWDKKRETLAQRAVAHPGMETLTSNEVKATSISKPTNGAHERESQSMAPTPSVVHQSPLHQGEKTTPSDASDSTQVANHETR